LRLNKGTAAFPLVDLVSDKPVNISPTIAEHSAFAKNNLSHLLHREWDSTNVEFSNDFSVSTLISYEDFGAKRFEIPIEIIFHPVWYKKKSNTNNWPDDKRPILVVKHGKIKRIA